MTRREHDFAHRVTVRTLSIIASLLREEEQQEFYREAMAVIDEELKGFEQERRREAARLAPMRNTHERRESNAVDQAEHH